MDWTHLRLDSMLSESITSTSLSAVSLNELCRAEKLAAAEQDCDRTSPATAVTMTRTNLRLIGVDILAADINDTVFLEPAVRSYFILWNCFNRELTIRTEPLISHRPRYGHHLMTLLSLSFPTSCLIANNY